MYTTHKPETAKMLILNGQHVSAETIDILAHEHELSVTGLTVYPKAGPDPEHPEGWFVYLPDRMHSGYPEIPEGIPEDLLDYCKLGSWIPGVRVLCLEMSGEGTPGMTGMLTTSTVHISQDTAKWLDDPENYGSGLHIYKKKSGGESFGWFVYFTDEDWFDTYLKAKGQEIPADLADCIRFAGSLDGVRALCLDRDANPVEGLPRYEWD